MTHLIYTRACYEGCALIAWTQVRLLCWWMTSWNKHSSKPTTLPPRDYMYSPKGTFISFLSVWSLTIRFVCTHSYIILHYILLRQTGRWGNFCVVEEESRSCSFTYMYLAQASTGRPLSPEGKKTDSSAAPRLSLDRNEESIHTYITCMREDYVTYTSRQWG